MARHPIGGTYTRRVAAGRVLKTKTIKKSQPQPRQGIAGLSEGQSRGKQRRQGGSERGGEGGAGEARCAAGRPDARQRGAGPRQRGQMRGSEARTAAARPGLRQGGQVCGAGGQVCTREARCAACAAGRSGARPRRPQDAATAHLQGLRVHDGNHCATGVPVGGLSHRASHDSTVWCHSKLSAGFSTQWFSLGNSRNSLGTPRRRSAV